jgi:hypothetical protein
MFDGNAGSSFFSKQVTVGGIKELNLCSKYKTGSTTEVQKSKKDLFCCHGLLSNPPDNIQHTNVPHSEKKEQEKGKLKNILTPLFGSVKALRPTRLSSVKLADYFARKDLADFLLEALLDFLAYGFAHSVFVS